MTQPCNSANAGMWILTALSWTQTGNITSIVPTWFDGQANFPAGRYRIKYVNGAYRPSSSYGWMVSSNWMVVTSLNNAIIELVTAPGNNPPNPPSVPNGVYPNAGFDTQETAENQNATTPYVDFDHTGGYLGLVLLDDNYSTNIAGSPNPTWQIIQLAQCPSTCVNQPISQQISILSGANRNPGQQDQSIRFLMGPANSSFPEVLGAGDFSNARSGPLAYVLNDNYYLWIYGLANNTSSKWIGTSPTSGVAGNTALYALQFNITNPFTCASLDLKYSVDNMLGGGPNEGIYINGEAIVGSQATTQFKITSITGPIKNNGSYHLVGNLTAATTKWVMAPNLSQLAGQYIVGSITVVETGQTYVYPGPAFVYQDHQIWFCESYGQPNSDNLFDDYSWQIAVSSQNGDTWNRQFEYINHNIGSMLQQGSNYLYILAANLGGPAGIIFEANITLYNQPATPVAGISGSSRASGSRFNSSVGSSSRGNSSVGSSRGSSSRSSSRSSGSKSSNSSPSNPGSSGSGNTPSVPAIIVDCDKETPQVGLMQARYKNLLDSLPTHPGGFGFVFKPGTYLTTEYGPDSILTGAVQFNSNSLSINCTQGQQGDDLVTTFNFDVSSNFLNSFCLNAIGGKGPKGDKGPKGVNGRDGTGDGPQGAPGNPGADAIVPDVFTGVQVNNLNTIYSTGVVALSLDPTSATLSVTKANLAVPDNSTPATQVIATPVYRDIVFTGELSPYTLDSNNNPVVDLGAWQLVTGANDPIGTADVSIVKLPAGWSGQQTGPAPVTTMLLSALITSIVEYYENLAVGIIQQWEVSIQQYIASEDSAARTILAALAQELTESEWSAPLQLCVDIQPITCPD